MAEPFDELPAPLGDLCQVTEAADTSAPGYFARVYAARLPGAVHAGGNRVAVKIMRARHLGDEAIYQAFEEEVQLLEVLQPTGKVPSLLKCGYLDPRSSGPGSPGTVLVCQDAEVFGGLREDMCSRGCYPFLVEEFIPFEQSLLRMVRLPIDEKGSQARLPYVDCLKLSLEYLEFMAACQEQGVYYLDHKLEHVYWPKSGHLRIIDWNAAFWAKEGQEGGESPASPDPSPLSRKELCYEDVRHFFERVLFPLYTGWHVNGAPVGASLSTGKRVLDSEIHPDPERGLDFYGAEEHLDDGIRGILSRGLNAMARGYRSPKQAHKELDEYVAGVRSKHALEWALLDGAADELRSIQSRLEPVSRRIELALSRCDKNEACLYKEMNRLHLALARFRAARVLP